MREAVRHRLQRYGWDLHRYVPPIRPLIPLEDHLRTLFAQLGVDCVLDVGGHVGRYGEMLRRIGFAGRIVSFEPVEANVRVLRTRLDPNWRLVTKAVGDEAGVRAITLTSGTEQHSFLRPSAFGRELRPELFRVVGEQTVEVLRLDDVFSEFVRPGDATFLKIDTQGFDFQVLLGAEESLASIAAVQLELPLRHTYEGQPDHLAVLAWLRDRGFELTGFFPIWFDSDLTVIEADCFCRRIGPHAASA
jgi:FkbM family methyltransferase